MNYKFAGLDVIKLAEEYSTPLYVVDENMIIDNINILKNSFDNKYKNANTYFASKAFLTKDMLRIVNDEKIGIDVASGGELYLAKTMNFPPEKIMFHGNGKTIKEITEGILYGVGHFVCDSLSEIMMINKISKENNIVQKILIRVTPGVDSDTHKHIQTSGYNSKFGVSVPSIINVVCEALKMENIKLSGFHFHVGSQLLTNKSHLLACKILLDVIKKLNDELNFVTEDFNLGGGFGTRYTNKDDPQKPSLFIDPMVEMIEEFCLANDLLRPNLYIEPGRWIVANASITLYTVNSTKQIPDGKKYASVDGGMNDNLRVALYEAKYEAVVANKLNYVDTEIVTIAGKCCESGDIIINDIDLPKLEWGDVIAVKTTGAYHHSLANNYNKNPLPALVMIKDKVSRLSVRRQTYEDVYLFDI